MSVSGLHGMDISSRGMCQAGPLHCHSILQFNLRRVVRSPMRRHVRAAVEEQDRGGEATPESLFMKELRRRGLSDKSDRGERPSVRTGTSDPPQAPEQPRSQLEVSRALNSEGLEGLIPRAKELLKLGFSFFLAFGPLILGIGGLAAVLYLTFGEQFVHGGRTGVSVPPYVDPYELLGEPTVDPFVPFSTPEAPPVEQPSSSAQGF